MKRATVTSSGVCVLLAILAAGTALSAQNKYGARVPNGIAFSEFRGYEGWTVIAISEKSGKIAAIIGNPMMVKAYGSGIPGNGKPFPDGSKVAKILWNPKKAETEPGGPTVPDTQTNANFMVKDSKRFADSGGWGWAVFDYDAASNTFTRPTSNPPQPDTKCGFACHSIAKGRDYVFTNYAHR